MMIHSPYKGISKTHRAQISSLSTHDSSLSQSVFVCFQSKYKEAGRKQVSSTLYSLLPETLETQHAKDATNLLSQVLRLHDTPVSRNAAGT